MNIDSFRAANKTDAEAIAVLVNGAYRPEAAAIGWTHESYLVTGNRTNAPKSLKSYQGIILFFLWASIMRQLWLALMLKDGNSSHIGMLAVNSVLQGAGTGKLMLAGAEKYASSVFGSEKCVMVVVSERTELVSFYLRRGYQKTGLVLDYPISVGGWHS